MQNGDGTYPRLWEDLRSAQRSITLQLYYGAPGRMADTLSEILRERAKAGVRVFVLYDAFGTVDIPANHRDELRAAGIVVEPFRPIRLSTLHLAQNRSHVRGIVIDSKVGWTGGFGIDDKWLGDGHSNGSWRETNVRFEGPAVRQLQAAFAAAWVEATGVMFTGRATVESARDGASILAAVDFSAPARGAFEYALALSKRHGAELVVIHAVPLNQAFSWRAGERLALSAKLRQKADQAHVELKHRVQQGDPAEIILLHARSLHPDVIVMGTHQRRGIDRLRVGSVAKRVAAKATVPVLLVPRRRDTGTIRPFSDVAVGVDFSDVSFHALSEALALAQRSGGHLRLLHVLDGFPYETVYSGSRAFA